MLKKTVLRDKRTFTAIYNKGKSVGDKYIVLFVKKNGLPYNRFAFLASKKVGNSVTRNRAKRLMKESYRAIRESIADGYDLLFIARKEICGKKLADVKPSVENAVKRAGVRKARGERPTGEARKTEGERQTSAVRKAGGER